ncbi:MAG: Mini-ribonuclease 3 [Clostridiales bacterium]|nr:Mini-ribonuclease 3 [Clostridiales bacterium]MDD6539538.1 ribonuclease III domain-containing protein [Bacillota bacterium]MDD7015825.1 ribonuclease III domain-containing protein [Bacillota bacterium]MDY4959885.1 ribonuclease III domain-containing protein [Lentihominibacter sp.]
MKETRLINTTALAYLGDAVYEQAVREHLLRTGIEDVHKLHGMATRFVRASAQALIIKTVFDELSETEQNLVKRARNRKPVTRAKNADPLDYRWATAMEALAGYLYLEGDTARLEWFMGRAVEIIEQGM